jgi:hypothetical protein
MFGLPHSHLSQIVPFFKIVEHERDHQGKRALITNCSISHTSASSLPLCVRVCVRAFQRCS